MQAAIYALCCPDTGEIRYIGKANDPMARLKSHLRDARRRRTPVYDWMNSLFRAGKVPQLRVLMQSQDWKADERRLIAEHRATGSRLLNLADGGDEPHCPTEVRAANGRRNAQIRCLTAEAKRLKYLRHTMTDLLRRGYVSEATKNRLREAVKRNPGFWGGFAGYL